jgi:hypothetical protein
VTPEKGRRGLSAKLADPASPIRVPLPLPAPAQSASELLNPTQAEGPFRATITVGKHQQSISTRSALLDKGMQEARRPRETE